MTGAGEGQAETLAMAAHAESTGVSYGQRIKVGHHEVTSDEPQVRGGGDTGVSPTGLLLAALAGCTATTLSMYAGRKGWELGTVRVDVKLFIAGEAQRIQRVIRLGAALTPEQQARLLEIADKTPVTKIVKSGIPIATRLA